MPLNFAAADLSSRPRAGVSSGARSRCSFSERWEKARVQLAAPLPGSAGGILSSNFSSSRCCCLQPVVLPSAQLQDGDKRVCESHRGRVAIISFLLCRLLLLAAAANDFAYVLRSEVCETNARSAARGGREKAPAGWHRVAEPRVPHSGSGVEPGAAVGKFQPRKARFCRNRLKRRCGERDGHEQTEPQLYCPLLRVFNRELSFFFCILSPPTSPGLAVLSRLCKGLKQHCCTVSDARIREFSGPAD